MPTILSAQSGDKDSGSTWVGGIVPGPNDVAQIEAHAITVSTAWTCTQVTLNHANGYLLINGNVTINAAFVIGNHVRNSAAFAVFRFIALSSLVINGSITVTGGGIVLFGNANASLHGWLLVAPGPSTGTIRTPSPAITTTVPIVQTVASLSSMAI